MKRFPLKRSIHKRNPRPIPAPPASLGAQLTALGQITVVLTVVNPSQFILQRSTDQITWTTIHTFDAYELSTFDSNLTDSTTYYYRAAGGTATRHSDWVYTSGVLAYTTLPTPTNLALANGTSGVDITWTYSLSLLNGFTIERAAGGSGVWSTSFTVAGSIRAYTDTTVAPSTSYDYRIQATAPTSPTGDSAFTSLQNITTSGAGSPPNAPTAASATATDSTHIRVDWTPGGTAGAQQTLQMSTDNFVSNTQTVTTSLTDTTATNLVGGLAPSTQYWFRLFAHNSGGNSAFSNVATATTAAGGVRQLIDFPGDYTYMGAVRVSGIAGFDARYASGLAFRHNAADVGNEKHLIMITQVNSFAVCEFRIPADASLSMGGANPLNPNNYPAVTGAKNYGTTPHFDSSGRYLGPNGSLGGAIGLFWNYIDDQLVILSSRGYFNDGHWIFSTLDYASATGLCVGGRWYFDNPQYKSTSTGGCVAPSGYAATYTNNARLCYGTGGTQSVASQGDMSMGFSLTASNFSQVTFPGDNLQVTDMACAGGTAVITSPSNSFPLDLPIGHQVRTFFPGDGGSQLHTVASVQSTGQITLDSSPSTTAKTGGSCSGTGTIVTDKHRLVGYSPTVGSPGAGHGRMTRPAGYDRIILADRYKVYADTWPANTYYYTDQTPGCVWVDSTERYGVIVLNVLSQRMTFYLNADIYSSYFGHSIAVYDPYKFAPASGSQPYDIQPDTHAFVQFPGLDYTTYVANATNPPNIAMQPFVTVTSIVSDASKKGSNNTGCLVTAPGHGLTGAQVTVEIHGSTDEFNSLWFFNVVDADHGYIFNPQNGVFWSGATDTQAGITIAKIGARMGNNANHGYPIGIAEDPTTHYVYVAINNQWAVNNASGAPLIHVYKPNFT